MTKRSGLRSAVLLAGWVLAGGALLAGQLVPPVWNNQPASLPSGVEHRTFFSRAIATDIGYNVVLPPGYASEQRRYPVLYMLHGLGGNENELVVPAARRIVAAMKEGSVPPFIAVLVNGADFSYYADSPDRLIPVETMFISELIPYVDATYRTLAERRGRAIEGFSMGGFGALAFGMEHVELFGSVVAYAPALLEVQKSADGLTLGRPGGTHAGGSVMSAELAAKNRLLFQRMFDGTPELFDKHSPWSLLRDRAQKLRAQLPVRIVIGTADGLSNANQLFHTAMLEHEYPHEFETVEGVAHNIGALYAAVGLKGLAFHAQAGGWR
jgi:S-formylglutathione hydrolase FrmB